MAPPGLGSGGPSLPAPSGPNAQRHLNSAADPRYPRQVSAVQGGFPKMAWPRLLPQLEQGLSAVGGHQRPPSQEEALKHLRGIASAMPQLIQRISRFPFLHSALSCSALTLTIENAFLKVNAQWVLLPRLPQWFLSTVMDLLQCLNGRVAQREGSHVPCLPGEGKVLARFFPSEQCFILHCFLRILSHTVLGKKTIHVSSNAAWKYPPIDFDGKI